MKVYSKDCFFPKVELWWYLILAFTSLIFEVLFKWEPSDLNSWQVGFWRFFRVLISLKCFLKITALLDSYVEIPLPCFFNCLPRFSTTPLEELGVNHSPGGSEDKHWRWLHLSWRSPQKSKVFCCFSLTSDFLS